MPAFRSTSPQVLTLGVDQRTTLEVHHEGALVVPTSGTYRLVSPLGVVLIEEEVDVVDSIAGVSLLATQVPTTWLPQFGYVEVWTLVIDAQTYRVRREAGVARYPLHQALTDADLLLEDPDLVDRLGSRTNLQNFLDAAWARLIRAIFGASQFHGHILDRTALIDCHRELTQHLVFRWLSTQGGGGDFAARAAAHERAYEQAWQRLGWRSDLNDDNVVDLGDGPVATTHRGINGAPIVNGRHRRLPGWA